MFDVGISEIMVIAVVALIVLGPEKLPKTARTLGHLFGRLQRYVAEVKADIHRELALEELKKLQTEVQTAATNLESSVTSAAREVESSVKAVESDLNAAAGASDTQASPTASTAPPQHAEKPASVAPTAESSRQASLPGFERG